MPDPRSESRPAQAPASPNAVSATRYLAWLYSPPAQQPVMAALCEIENEVLGSLRPGIDHQVAHARLQWWGEECERTGQGRPVHPLTRALVKATGGAAAANDSSRGAVGRPSTLQDSMTAPAPSPLGGISGLVDTAVWDLAGATFETRKELTAYCERWAAAMFESVPAMSNAPNTSWRQLGAAVREIELLTHLARDAHAGRLRLPLDELERAGVDTKSLGMPPWPPPLVSLVRARHEALRAAVGDSVSAFAGNEQADFRGLMVWAALAWRQSLRAQRALPDVIHTRRYHPLSDGWQAWRAARRAVGGHLRLN